MCILQFALDKIRILPVLKWRYLKIKLVNENIQRAGLKGPGISESHAKLYLALV